MTCFLSVPAVTKPAFSTGNLSSTVSLPTSAQERSPSRTQPFLNLLRHGAARTCGGGGRAAVLAANSGLQGPQPAPRLATAFDGSLHWEPQSKSYNRSERQTESSVGSPHELEPCSRNPDACEQITNFSPDVRLHSCKTATRMCCKQNSQASGVSDVAVITGSLQGHVSQGLCDRR